MCKEYVKRIDSFIDIAKYHLDNERKTCCWGKDCLNTRLHDQITIQRHLYWYSFSKSYDKLLIFHGDNTNQGYNLNDMFTDEMYN